MLKKAVQQGRRRVESEAYPRRYIEEFDEPRTTLAGFFSILSEEPVLLEIIFVDDRSWFGGNLPPFLQQSFDIFPDHI